MHILSGHLRSSPVLTGVRFTRSLVLCVCFVDGCLSVCPFSFGHCIVCPSSIYGFWLPLWHLQILLAIRISSTVIKQRSRTQAKYHCCAVKSKERWHRKLQSETDTKTFKSFHYERTCIVLCFVFRHLVCPMLPVSLDCSFFAAQSVFSDVYFNILPCFKYNL